MESTWQSTDDSFVGHDSLVRAVQTPPMPTAADGDHQHAHAPARDVNDDVRIVDGQDLSMWVDRRVRSSDGDSLGITVGVHVHGDSPHPVWLIVDTGNPGTPTVMAPARGSSLLGDDIVIRPDRDTVLTAPTVNGLNAMDPDDARSLVDHYVRRACVIVDPSQGCVS